MSPSRAADKVLKSEMKGEIKAPSLEKVDEVDEPTLTQQDQGELEDLLDFFDVGH